MMNIILHAVIISQTSFHSRRIEEGGVSVQDLSFQRKEIH